ncbi:FecR family protein [Pedobacter sp. MC2016-24]|uniref:FecR family protein n=1 Tax=Pedobacter sp. MC2016-24 TaxID=2780090 RepID=UPI00187E8D51|nr:FecR family protein [Pedobacter sp. MC2016-24]MBE9599743.1 FecR family protein [Pedobacter sp. MC2016-24]
MKISTTLIDKYLKDSCTAEERELVHAWYRSFEYEEEPLAGLSELQQQALNQRMLDQIDRNILKSENQSSKKTTYFRYFSIGLAATLLVLLGLFLFQTEQPVKVKHKIEMAAVSDLIMLQNDSKKMKRQALSDGTIIWLKPQSQIVYPKSFAGNKFREVTLNGEAFFDVKHDNAQPFIIKTGHVLTKVLGTSFNVKAYNNAERAEVSVVTGKVLVYLDKKSDDKHTSEVYLLPNQKAVYAKTTQDLHKEKDLSLKIWEKDNFTFDDTPIMEVVKTLEKHFLVHIQIQNPEIKKYTLKADFSKQNLPNILELLSKSMDISYEILDQQILINKNE